MLIIPAPITRGRYIRFGSERNDAPRSPTPVLVAAAYVSGGPLVLTFDRAIDTDFFLAGSVRVNDGEANVVLNGMSIQTIDERFAQIELQISELTPTEGVFLDADAQNGIVAAGGGGEMWAGVEGVTLPFPN